MNLQEKAVVDAAIAWADATVSTQYDAENKFWKAVQDLKDLRLEESRPENV